MLKAILSGLLLIFFAAPALSQQAPQASGEGSQPQSIAKQADQEPAANQRGTEQAPFIVKILPAQETKPETDGDAKEREEKMQLDRKLVEFNGDLANYTKFLVGVGFLQLLALVAQVVYLARTLIHSQRTERAFISGGGVPDATFFQLHINNYGQTPGRLLEFACEFWTQPGVPPRPNYNRIPWRADIAQGTRGAALRNFDYPPNPQFPIIVYGRFWYRTTGFTRRIHTYGFIYQIRPGQVFPLSVQANPEFTEGD